jgi:hypothetical protein
MAQQVAGGAPMLRLLLLLHMLHMLQGAAAPAPAAAPAAAEAVAWRQDRFVISMCNDPIVTPDQLAFRYQEMADANFTMVSSSAWLTPAAARAWDAPTRMAHGLTALRAAEAAGLKIIFALFAERDVQPWDNATGYLNASSALINDTSSSGGGGGSALWGWLLADEPNTPDTIRSLARLKDQVPQTYNDVSN